MIKVAITGNIASGKSEFESIISKKYPVYDTDKIAHEILGTLDDFYGYDVFTNGKIDRKKLGELVFRDNNVKKQLEEIIHPRVIKQVNEIFDKHQNDDLVFVSVPLLFEIGMEKLFDKIIIITTDENTRIKRLMKRNNLTKEEALARINSQMQEDEKSNKSDFVVNNIYDRKYLEEQADKILQVLQKL